MYEPKIGDIATVKVHVTAVTLGNEVATVVVANPHEDYGPFYVHSKNLTLVERPVRELNIGDRLVYQETATYIYTGNGMFYRVTDYGFFPRNELSFDSEPWKWKVYPTPDTPEK